jgi:hypothetical protein
MAIVIVYAFVAASTDSNCVHSSSETCSNPRSTFETTKQLKEVVTCKLFFAYWLLALGSWTTSRLSNCKGAGHMITLESTCKTYISALYHSQRDSNSESLLFWPFPSACAHLTSQCTPHINHTYSLDPTQSTTNLNPPVPSHARITPEDIIWIDGLLYCE